MMNIQKKSLQHISDTLGKFDTYPTYSALIDIIKHHGIDAKIRHEILGVYQENITEQRKFVNEAKSWTDSLLEDIN